MAFSRIALCLVALALGCDSRPAAPAAQAPQPSTPQRAPSSPEERLQAWVPGADPHGGGAPANPHGAGNAHEGAANPHGPVGAMQGVVRETMNSGGYSYMRLDVSGTERWVATTQMPVSVGDTVAVGGGSVMSDFHSRTLNRTFPEILFAGEVRVVGGSAAQAPAPNAAPTPPSEPPNAPPTAAPPAPAPSNAHAEAPAEMGPAARHGVVRETMNSGGYTYVRVESGGTSTWAAVPQTTVAVGDEVDVSAGNEMPGFHSRTLNRTFEQLTFASALRVTRHAAH